MAEFNNSNDNMTPNQNGQGNFPNQSTNQPTQGNSFANNPQFNGQNSGQFQQNPYANGQPTQPQFTRPQQPQYNQNAQNFANSNSPYNTQQYQQANYQNTAQPHNPAQQPQFQQVNRPNTVQQPQQFAQPHNPMQQPNQPQGHSTIQSKKTLSEEDKERLRQVNRDNVDIKKSRKHLKKPFITENARPLFKVRRLYSAKIAHRMYYERMLEIARLRALANEGGKKGAALIGTAAKKTRNLIATLLIVFAILAVVGTGTFITISILNQEQKSFEFSQTIKLLDEEQIKASITDYEFGTDIARPITIENVTGQEIYVNLIIEVTPNQEMEYAIKNEGVDFRHLVFTPIYKNDDTFKYTDWIIEDCNYVETKENDVVVSRKLRYSMYYKPKISISNNNTLNFLGGYKFDLDNTTTDHDKWIINGRGVSVTFTINYVAVGKYNADSDNAELGDSWLNAPTDWKNNREK